MPVGVFDRVGETIDLTEALEAQIVPISFTSPKPAPVAGFGVHDDRSGGIAVTASGMQPSHIRTTRSTGPESGRFRQSPDGERSCRSTPGHKYDYVPRATMGPTCEARGGRMAAAKATTSSDAEREAAVLECRHTCERVCWWLLRHRKPRKLRGQTNLSGRICQSDSHGTCLNVPLRPTALSRFPGSSHFAFPASVLSRARLRRSAPPSLGVSRILGMSFRRRSAIRLRNPASPISPSPMCA